MKIKEKTGVRYCREYPQEVMAEAVPTGVRAVLGNRGWTLIELLLVTMILAILVTLAIPSFTQFKNSAKIGRCAEEIRGIEKVVRAYQADRGVLPDSLGEVGQDAVKDPWGNTYFYLKIPTGGPSYFGRYEELNRDFDLYSTGGDADCSHTLSDEACQNDVIRANDGSWVGVASAF